MVLLSVKDLRTHFFTDSGVVKAVDGVGFDLARGEALGFVGESGCGKSMLALSLLRLVPDPPGRIVSGSVMFQMTRAGGPVDLLRLSERQMRTVRGKRLAMVFQEPMTSLNPVYTVGDQIAEAVSLHEGGSRAAVQERVRQMLDLVGIAQPAQRMRDYPHQLSGGMRQRVMIAMALSCRPDILIADEPTTALDVTIQAQILDLIKRLQSELGMALMLVTHDLGVIAETAKRVIVMYAGRFVEEGTVEQIFAEPMHPYTQGLLAAIPPMARKREDERFATIPGTVPDLAELPVGCAFAERCPKAKERCRQEEVPEDPCNVGRLVRCFYAEKLRS
ncbi:MAG: ABC transporter ATP-binding protein [Proteobacteria bacterium]|nr:ABC transporter ATP-binding protein [Pseudomonadota bacterium]